MLEADVEVDRREFPVRAELRVAAGGAACAVRPVRRWQDHAAGGDRRAGAAAPRPGRAGRPGAHLHERRRRSACPPWRRRVGLLRQDPGLFPHLSVRANLGYAPGADPSGRGAGPARRGAGHRRPAGRRCPPGCPAARRTGSRSGGCCSRTATRCCSTSPTPAWTPACGGRSPTWWPSWSTARQVPAVLVAHELAEAQAFADRLAVLDRGDLLQVGAPDEVVLRPASRRVAELVGYLGFVPAAGPDRLPWPGSIPERVTGGRSPRPRARPDRDGRRLPPAGAGLGSRPGGRGAVGDCHLTGLRPRAGVTAVDPPLVGPDGHRAWTRRWFGPDGGRRSAAVRRQSSGPGGPGRPNPAAGAARCSASRLPGGSGRRSGWPARPGASRSSSWPAWPGSPARPSRRSSPGSPTPRCAWRWRWPGHWA